MAENMKHETQVWPQSCLMKGKATHGELKKWNSISTEGISPQTRVGQSSYCNLIKANGKRFDHTKLSKQTRNTYKHIACLYVCTYVKCTHLRAALYLYFIVYFSWNLHVNKERSSHTHKPESGTGSNDRRTEKQIGIGMQCHTGPGKPNDVIFWVIYSLALLSSYGSYTCSFSWRVSIWLKAPRQVIVPLSCCYVQRISHIITVPLSMQFKANNSGNCQKGRRLWYMI